MIGHLQQMVHETHGFYSKIINEIWHLSVLLLKITSKNARMITLSDEKSGTMLFKDLEMGFVENKGQSGPLSVKSKPQGKCQ